jgi:hypothetical protein
MKKVWFSLLDEGKRSRPGTRKVAVQDDANVNELKVAIKARIPEFMVQFPLSMFHSTISLSSQQRSKKILWQHCASELPLWHARDKTRAFQQFSSRNYKIEAEHIQDWLGDTPVILLVDELSNLTELTARNSPQATKFGQFIKNNFLGRRERYFVFSSHLLTTLGFFGEFLDPSVGSTRHVILQELPLVTNLTIARDCLYQSLNGSREAIYYGLVPGMIYEKGRGKPIVGKKQSAVERYLEEEKQEDKKKTRVQENCDLSDHWGCSGHSFKSSYSLG